MLKYGNRKHMMVPLFRTHINVTNKHTYFLISTLKNYTTYVVKCVYHLVAARVTVRRLRDLVITWLFFTQAGPRAVILKFYCHVLSSYIFISEWSESHFGSCFLV